MYSLPHYASKNAELKSTTTNGWRHFGQSKRRKSFVLFPIQSEKSPDSGIFTCDSTNKCIMPSSRERHEGLIGRGPSSETQGQSVGSGEKARRKFSSTGERAPGYRLSPNYFQKVKRIPAPDWAQKMLCIIVPNQRTVSPEFLS